MLCSVCLFETLLSTWQLIVSLLQHHFRSYPLTFANNLFLLHRITSVCYFSNPKEFSWWTPTSDLCLISSLPFGTILSGGWRFQFLFLLVLKPFWSAYQSWHHWNYSCQDKLWVIIQWSILRPRCTLANSVTRVSWIVPLVSFTSFNSFPGTTLPWFFLLNSFQ